MEMTPPDIGSMVVVMVIAASLFVLPPRLLRRSWERGWAPWSFWLIGLGLGLVYGAAPAIARQRGMVPFSADLLAALVIIPATVVIAFPPSRNFSFNRIIHAPLPLRMRAAVAFFAGSLFGQIVGGMALQALGGEAGLGTR